MSSADQSIYEQCSSQFDANDSLDGLLQCISTGNEQHTTNTRTDISAGINTFFLLFAGSLVYFMQTGFAMLCAGSIRAKNVKNVILWNLLDSCGGGIAFWAIGYAFAYGGDDMSGNFTFIGNTDFFVNSSQDVALESWFFQFAFACALSSIVAGTIAERLQMRAYLCYSVFLVGFVYPVVAHSLWSTNGFLSKFSPNPLWGSGAIDLAGSGAVHMTGGVAALVGTMILGPRIGRFYDRDGNLLEEPHDFPPHNTSLQFLGTFALWFGWYGFNPGSVLYISTAQHGQVAALVAVNTTLGACAGAISAMFTSSFIDWRRTGIFTYDVMYTMNGCLTGLVAITAGCATVETWAAVVIGIVAGWVYLGISKLLVWLRLDDAVDAIPVHCGGGMWGLISTGLFTAPYLLEQAYDNDQHFGWFYEWGRGSGDFTLMGCQLIAVLFIFAWTFSLMGFWFYMIHLLGWLRVAEDEELAGLDISVHKGSAYNLEAPSETDIERLSIRRESQHKLHIDNSTRSRGSAKSSSKNGDVEKTGNDEEVNA